MAYYFDEAHYLASKLAQLKAAKIKDATGKDFTAETLKAGLASLGLTPQKHYELYGRAEGLNPNPYFNEYEYLLAKTKQLNSIKFGGRSDWTAAEVLQGMRDSGMLPVEHYERFGCFETDAAGRFINPSNAFDANAYWAAKLYDLHQNPATADVTLEQMIQGFKDSKLSPVSHYASSGAGEADASGNAFVQTVPVSQRVGNDPSRDMTGDYVPGNYMGATPAPSNSNARPAQNPCDVGNLADDAVSPPPVYPAGNLPVPGDANYHPLPANIKPGAGVVVIPPMGDDPAKVDGNWLVVDPDKGTAIVVGTDGAILGQVDVTVSPNADGSSTVSLPGTSNVAVDTLPPVDPDTLPPSITVNDGLDNNFIDTDPPVIDPPAVETGGITALVEVSGDMTIEGSIRSTGKSSVTLNDSGIATLTGHADGAQTPTADALGANKTLDARQVDGSGTLTIDASACAVSGIEILAALDVQNIIYAGKDTKNIGGGNKADTITVGNGGKVTNVINGGKGNDTITVERGGKADDIAGGDGNDKIYISGEADYIYGDGFAASDGTSGDDIIIVESGGVVTGSISGGNGNDTISIAMGAIVKGGISGGVGNSKITVAAGGLVQGDILGGNGDGKISIAVGANVRGAIDGGNGTDTLAVTGAGLLDLSSNTVSGFEILDLETDTSAQRLTIKSGAMSDGGTVKLGAGDVVVFSDLTAGTKAVDGSNINSGQWWYDNSSKTVTIGGTSTTTSFSFEGDVTFIKGTGGNGSMFYSAVIPTPLDIRFGTKSAAEVSITGALELGKTSEVTLNGSTDEVSLSSNGVRLESYRPFDGATRTLDASGVTAPYNDVLQITLGSVTGDITVRGSLTAVNDIIIMAGSGGDSAITGSVFGGNSNDTIFVDSGSSAGAIYGGQGADTVTLSTPGQTVAQNQGDSGIFIAPASGEVVSTATFDVVDCPAMGGVVSIKVTGYSTFTDWYVGISEASSLSAIPQAGDNKAHYVKGTYDAAAKTFTTAANGTGCLLVYDSDSGAGATNLEAVVVLGTTTVDFATDIDGTLEATIT